MTSAGADGKKRVSRSGSVAVVLVAVAVTIALAWGGGGRAAASAQAGRVAALAAAQPDAGIAFPLHTSGPSIVDAKGHSLLLRFVNWYGAESQDYVVGGLKYQPINTIINEIVEMGFNGVRLPWSNQMWESNPTVSSAVLTANPQFIGEKARTIFEQVVRDLASAGLMVILDDHNSNAEWCCTGSDGNTLWYNAQYPQSRWLADWKSMTAQFQGIPAVIGVDLRNEPRGTASWGGSAATDWHAAAELGGDAVQSVDPRMLVFVEGVNYATDLSGVKSLPIVLTDSDHVVYEAHNYGFDYSPMPDYDELMSKIQSAWGYLAGKLPLWVGEFGTCNTADSCTGSTDSADLGEWFSVMTRYLGYHNINWSYWALNGTKSDDKGIAYGITEGYGILNKAWSGPSRASLLSALQMIQPRCAAAPLANGTYYLRNAGSGDVIDIPQSKTAPGTDLEQWPLNHGRNQQWTLASLGCGLYSIKSAADGESLDIWNQSTASGAKVDEYGYWGGGNQQFVIARDATGSYTISSINSLYPVEVPGASKTAGTLLDQRQRDGGTNQEWTFLQA
jgi:endoglucanase